jgi:hypothetical protein
MSRYHNEFELTVIPGTFLIRLADAARLSAKDRNRRGLYLCTKCGSLKIIRDGNVHAGNTVACGCVGRERFIAYWASKARNIRYSFWKVVMSMLKLLKETLPHPVACLRVSRKLQIPRYLASAIWNVWKPAESEFEARSREMRAEDRAKRQADPEKYFRLDQEIIERKEAMSLGEATILTPC